MDKIKIKDLEVFARHGVLPEENILGQKFLVSVTIYMDTSEAGCNDDLNKSVNYAEVCSLVKEFMENNTFKLIEAVAEHLAMKLLLFIGEKAEKVSIEIKKPWAPVMLSLDTVSVEIERKWHKVYIALGSNMGNKKQYLDNAVKAINDNKQCIVKKVSDFIITEPVGNVEQDDFLNGCMEIYTLYSPYELLKFLNKIENDFGRERIIHWGPRTLDLDIIMYDDLIMNDEQLTIPHIEMTNRRFVLEPLAQIAPYAIHPVCKLSIKDLLNKI